MKLRLTGRGFENYTGQMGIHYFENGISVYDVLKADALRLAGTIGAEWLDGTPANVGDVYTANLKVEAPLDPKASRTDPMAQAVGFANATQVVGHTQNVAELQFKASGLSAESAKAAPPKVTAEKPKPKPKPKPNHPISNEKYTREQLEDIADKSGFVGLREVGNSVGVKAGSINALIDEILAVAGAVGDK